MSDSYRALLGRSSARRLAAALAFAWLSFGMVGLALFLTARGATGSDGAAGLVVGAFALGSGALAPVRGQLLDRRGTAVWLPLLAVCYAVSLVVAAVARAEWLLALAAAGAGLAAPPLVATVRGRWPAAVEPSLLRRAYALTSLVSDVGTVVAPALGGLLFAFAPEAPLLVCALAAPLATALLVRGGAPGRLRAGEAPSPRLAGMRTIVVVSAALGAALGLVEIAVPAAAVHWGVVRASGLLLGAFGLGSVAGGLWFGSRSWRRSAEQRYLVAILALGAGLAPLVAGSDPVRLGLLLVVAGLAFGPATISLFEALDAAAPAGAIEALTWVTTAEAVGTAAGSAASGWASGALGTWSPFALASAGLVLVASVALAVRR